MSTPYVVQEGDWGAKIANEHGFKTFGEIYNHPDNLSFRQKRPNPNKIFPGDIIMIPDKLVPPGPSGGGQGGVPPQPPQPPGPPGPLPGQTTTGKFVVALKFDTLCSIAVEEGFANCATLRGDPANAQFLDRALQPGDRVHIPAKGQGGGTGTTTVQHTFQRKGKPFATIRFVHGTPNLLYKDDPE